MVDSYQPISRREGEREREHRTKKNQELEVPGLRSAADMWDEILLCRTKCLSSGANVIMWKQMSILCFKVLQKI
jgi:hypothetical protein